MKTIDYDKRFWKYVEKSNNGCWTWLRGKTKAGYGYLTINYKNHYAHRLSWRLTYGIIPKNAVIMHRCDNPACVNPEHLRLGTQKDNLQDMWNKQRGSMGNEHPFAKVTDEDVKKIRKLGKIKNLYRREIGEMFGISRQAVTDIIYNRTWKHIH